MTNITNPVSAGKALDFNTFERLAKDAQVDNKATVHLATQTGGRIVVGLEAKTPIAGKKINLLGKPISDLSKATEPQRNGILATQAFKQALVQRYGETIANAVDKHLLQSGQAKILTAEDLRKNLKVAAAIVRILREASTPVTRNHELSNSSSRRNDDGSPIASSASSRSSSVASNHELSNSSSSRNADGSPLEPSLPPRSRSASSDSKTGNEEIYDRLTPKSAEEIFDHLTPKEEEEVFDHLEPQLDVDGEQVKWKSPNPLYVSAETAHEIADEAAHLLDEKGNQIAAQRPRTHRLAPGELEASFKAFEESSKNALDKTNKS
jgi:hypothetical protein